MLQVSASVLPDLGLLVVWSVLHFCKCSQACYRGRLSTTIIIVFTYVVIINIHSSILHAGGIKLILGYLAVQIHIILTCSFYKYYSYVAYFW